MLKRYFFLAVVLVATLSGTAAAQDGNTTVELPGAEAETCDQYLTEYISLCSVEYDDGHAVLVFESDRRERVTITEAVALTEFREINRQSYVLDGRTTVRFPLDAGSGASGVTVDDGASLYGVPVTGSQALFGGPWGPSDAQAAGLGGALSVALVTLLLVFRAAKGDSQEGERIA